MFNVIGALKNSDYALVYSNFGSLLFGRTW